MTVWYHGEPAWRDQYEHLVVRHGDVNCTRNVEDLQELFLRTTTTAYTDNDISQGSARSLALPTTRTQDRLKNSKTFVNKTRQIDKLKTVRGASIPAPLENSIRTQGKST